MLTDEQTAALEAAWAPARTSGVLGGATIDELWEHTAGFTSAVCSHFSADADELEIRLIDVGTGAGIPGLLLAVQLPRAEVVLVDALERRLDHVRRARRALDLETRTIVQHGRADELGHHPPFREGFDVAVARLLGDPAESLELLLPFVRDEGVVIVSTSTASEPVWGQLPAGTAVVSGADERYVAVPRVGPLPTALPRREKARRRHPLLGAD